MVNTTQIASTLAKTWIKGGKAAITQASAVNVQEVVAGLSRGVGAKSTAIGDTISFALKKFLPPTETEVKNILARHSITGNSFCKGDVLLSKPFINHNNDIFLKRLDEIFPAVKGRKTYAVEDIMVCLEDINHSGFKDKEAFIQQFIKDLNEVKLMTDKAGNRLFDQGVSSLYSMKAILQAKYNNPERYNDIVNLYKLVKQGKAPDYILRGLIPEGEFHVLAKSDIQKLVQGKHYFEQFTSSATSSDILTKTQNGEAFSIGDRMFVRTADNYEELKLSKTMYEKLFPPIERYAIAQTEDSCHFVATLDGIMKNPDTRINLYRMFTQTGEHTVKVTLPKMPTNTLEDDFQTIPIDFDIKSIDYLNADYLQGALGHKMVEHAVGLNANRCLKDSTTNALKHINGGGNPEEFDMPFLLGRSANKITLANVATKKTLLDRSKGNVLTVLTAENHKARAGYLPTAVNRNIGYSAGHVYSSQNGKLSNPWNTIEMLPYPEFECPTPYAVYV